MYPYNHKMGQKIQSNVDGVSFDRAFLSRFHVDGDDATTQDLVGVLAATALTDSAQNITESITSPDVPRSARIKGNAAGIAGDVVVHGTNYADEVISETVALDGANAVEGIKAFKTFTQIDLPAETHAGTDTVSVGFGNKLGLPYLLPHNTALKAYRNNVLEGTAPTVATSETDVESNTVLLNSALNGTDIDVYLMV